MQKKMCQAETSEEDDTARPANTIKHQWVFRRLYNKATKGWQNGNEGMYRYDVYTQEAR